MKISDVDYSADLIDKTIIYVHTTDGQHVLSLPVYNVTGTVIIGTNKINKVGGEVYLNYP